MARFGRAASRLCISFYSVANFLCFVLDPKTRHSKLITFDYLRSFNIYSFYGLPFRCRSSSILSLGMDTCQNARIVCHSLLDIVSSEPSMSFRSFPLVLYAPVPAPYFILLMRPSTANSLLGLHRSESRLLNPFGLFARCSQYVLSFGPFTSIWRFKVKIRGYKVPPSATFKKPIA